MKLLDLNAMKISEPIKTGGFASIFTFGDKACDCCTQMKKQYCTFIFKVTNNSSSNPYNGLEVKILSEIHQKDSSMALYTRQAAATQRDAVSRCGKLRHVASRCGTLRHAASRCVAAACRMYRANGTIYRSCLFRAI